MELVDTIRSDFPDFTYKLGNRFQWSPDQRIVWYTKETKASAVWSLLHELGHALLDHQDYTRDLELITLEVAAWQKAKELGEKYGIKIEQDHIEDCLDGYRGWLHQRSTCPECQTVTTQAAKNMYQCFNCSTTWKVPLSPLCRVQRRKQR